MEPEPSVKSKMEGWSNLFSRSKVIYLSTKTNDCLYGELYTSYGYACYIVNGHYTNSHTHLWSLTVVVVVVVVVAY